MMRSIESFPRRACLAAGVALAALLASRAPESFELGRAALANGEWWRLWTHALVHASAAHACFDVGAFVVLLLGFGLSRRAAWAAVVGTPLIGLGTLASHPEFASTCGLSGLLHGLFVLTALEQSAKASGWRRALFVGSALAVTGKAAWEFASGTPLLTGGTDLGAPIAFAAHSVGAALGWALGLSVVRDGVRRRARAAGPPARRTASCAGSRFSRPAHTRS
ncbi:MAG: rhombosortase [Planctomycetes bacterium]|nr:rhombosortase [Planctomycetota bacterium]